MSTVTGSPFLSAMLSAMPSSASPSSASLSTGAAALVGSAVAVARCCPRRWTGLRGRVGTCAEEVPSDFHAGVFVVCSLSDVSAIGSRASVPGISIRELLDVGVGRMGASAPAVTVGKVGVERLAVDIERFWGLVT